MPIDSVERSMNLLALLLNTRQPVTLVEIAGSLTDQYPDKEVARRQAFERDKAALREIGVPISQQVMTGHQAGQTGYWVDPREYELTNLDLADDERRALQLAVATVHLGTSTGEEALWKLGSAAEHAPAPLSAAVPELPGLAQLNEARTRRAGVEFTYRGTVRRLDPYGLMLRDGFWYVVGHDHAHDEQRTYRVDRIEGSVTIGEPGTFVPPADFDVTTAFPADPKQLGLDGPTREAIVQIDPVRAAAVAADVGTDRVIERRDDGGIVVSVPFSNVRALRSWVLGLLEHAVVLEPADVRAELIEWLESVATPEPR